MAYAFIKDGKVAEYPLFPGDIQLRYPNTSFPIPFVPPSDYIIVEPTPQPPVTYKQNLSEGQPKFVGDTLTQTWVISDATPEQIQERTDAKAQEVRGQRNSLLSASDWVVIKATEQGVPVPENYITYREDLRNVTDQPGFPFDVVWPTHP